jgi:hypothetical protein
MSRVEVVVGGILLSNMNKRFAEWFEGYLRARYKAVDVQVRDNEVGIVVERDMFELFAEVYRVVEGIIDASNASVQVAMCSDGSECIDLSRNRDEEFIVVMSKYKIRRLEKVRNLIKRMLIDTELPNVHVVGEGGRIQVVTDCRNVTLYVDEAIALSERLLSEVYVNTKLWILRKAVDELIKLVRQDDIRRDIGLVNVDIEKTYYGFLVTISGCRMYLDYEEALRFVYNLLTWSIVGLKKSLESVDEYGIDVGGE